MNPNDTELADGWGDTYLLSLGETAHQLSISRTTLWRLIRAGELDTLQIGSRTFVSVLALRDFLKRHTTKRTPARPSSLDHAD